MLTPYVLKLVLRFKMEGDKAVIYVVVPNVGEDACKEAADGCPVATTKKILVFDNLQVLHLFEIEC